MVADRGITGDHATVHRLVVRYSPELLERFNQYKRAITGNWHVDETYIKVRGQWMYLYRAINSNRNTVEFWVIERRNLTAAKRFLRNVLSATASEELRFKATATTTSYSVFGQLSSSERALLH
jgi:transposase-like protein